MLNTTQANNILKLITGKIEYIQGTGECYLGLSTTTPNANGSNFHEPDPYECPSYSRVRLNLSAEAEATDIWGEVVDGVVTNIQEIRTPICSDRNGWGTLTHFGIFDSETNGIPLAFDAITDPMGQPDENGKRPAKPLTVAVDHMIVFRPGALQLKLL